MNTLYIITGPAGVGKSTISKKIAEGRKKSVLLEGDEIYHHVVGGYKSPWMEGNHLDLLFNVSINIIKTYLEEGYDVIYNYIINPDNLKMFEENFREYNIKFVVLLVDGDTLLKRDSQRPEDCQMKERCLVLLENFKKHNYDSKYILNEKDLSIEDIVKIIESEDRFIIKGE